MAKRIKLDWAFENVQKASIISMEFYYYYYYTQMHLTYTQDSS